MLDNVKMAIDQGYLSATGDVLAPLERMRKLAREKFAITTEGARAEPTPALVRRATRANRHIEIQPGDTVVLSSSPIPGNELLINRTIDNLYRQGAEVLFSRIASVHVRGHAAQEELKLMIGLVKPRYFVPVHGEYRHLWMHSMIARSMGLPAENVFTLEDGDILELDAKGARVAGRTSADWVYVDGLAVGIDRIVLRDRAHLAGDGVIVAIVGLDRQKGKPNRRPDGVFKGIIANEKSDRRIG